MGPFCALAFQDWACLAEKITENVYYETTNRMHFLSHSFQYSLGRDFRRANDAHHRLLVSSNAAIIITATFGNFTNSTEVVLGGFQLRKVISRPWKNEIPTRWRGRRSLSFPTPFSSAIIR